jgi:diguanylate cyclase (GGDEF)-like protein/PAS domain S-box-containing protein
LAEQLSDAEAESRGAINAELDALRCWLAERAKDAPENFEHMRLAVEAERHASLGDFTAAAAGFDLVLEKLRKQGRPRFQAIILERAARLHMRFGLHKTGRQLLNEAHESWRRWGAVDRAERLRQEFPFLATTVRSQHEISAEIASGSKHETHSLDLLAAVRASQALSSETNPDKLMDRVIGLMQEMTGATTAALLLNSDAGWKLAAGVQNGQPMRSVPLAEAVQECLLPGKVIQLVSRTAEPLIVGDVVEDRRIAGDPYFQMHKHSAVLAVPVLLRGKMRGLLYLENNLVAGAFTEERITAVSLMAGQLAISQAEVALRTSEERYRLLFERNLAGVFRSTEDGKLLECNEAFCRLLGYDSRQEIYETEMSTHYLQEPDRDVLLKKVRDLGQLINHEMRLRRKDGSLVTALSNISLVSGESGSPAFLQGNIVDISELRSLQDQLMQSNRHLEEIAYHDMLTSLPNRRMFTEQFRARLTLARRHGDPFGLLLVDLDDFKRINDVFGHDAGDAVLIETAIRLRAAVRESDCAARMGGDEFGILLVSAQDKAGIEAVCRRILDSIAVGMPFKGTNLMIRCSIGAAVFPDGGNTEEGLYKSADLALYDAKRTGSNVFFGH